MLKEGDRIPEFSLLGDDGNIYTNESIKGKKTVIYFYPRSNTPGCTKEAQSFQRVYDMLISNGINVIGISPDKQSNQIKFKEKYELPFILLSDEDKSVADKFGAYGEKKLYGKVSMGIIRSTFIVDEEGTVIKAYPKVKAAEHGEEIAKFFELI
ncbi:thioredoxin-dependent thiol peroxidase [Tyzzerella sp. An114]|uniref:thioredoxin-dependent thiol peroxidase n=1 Tax=Tyzzerella sp. An114 TaxID=1965545 RepID=UPI000B436F1B|nr:thioredoxin-dependent thiol peroxidase [Tyzzerella sp. An114]OUQ58461.1 thioredoxin-dependent thiol peroxidase [Tyzzerella sp. An114]